MGQIQLPQLPATLILTSVDRLVAINSDGGLAVGASHIILLGENAGANLGALTDIIGLGRNVLSAGLSDLTLSGTIAIGGNAGAALLTGISGGVNGADVIIGREAAQHMVFGGGDVIIGDRALQTSTGAGGGINDDFLVIIGAEAAQYLSSIGQRSTASVIVGYRAARAGTNPLIATGAVSLSVIVGYQAALNAVATGGTLGNSILIGANCGVNVAFGGFGLNNCVLVGADIGSTGTGFGRAINCVIVGSSINSQALNGSNSQCTALGYAIQEVGASFNTVLGSGAAVSVDAVGCISLGHGAGSTNQLGDQFRLCIENFDGATRNRVIYADMGKGSMIVGNGVFATENLPGTNLLKILDGTATGNPVGGGMLYGVAGQLKWRDPAGVDYSLTPSANLGTFTVVTLPAAPPASARAFVSDALAPAFNNAPVGGGAVFVPVFFTGAAWRVG